MSQLRIAALFRYPVKSMSGELVSSLRLTPHGVEYDRLFAFESPKAPPGMLRVTSAERRRLLEYRASATGQVTTPAGDTLPITSPALLQRLREHLESPGLVLTHSDIPQTDCRPLSLLSVQTLRQLSGELGIPIDPQRFRANLLLDQPSATGFHEDTLLGQRLRIGDAAVIEILERDPRCRFITFDPADPLAPPDIPLINHLHRHHQSRAGVYARIVTPGLIREGDLVISLP